MTIEEFHRLHNFHVHEKDVYGREITKALEGIRYELMHKMDKAITLAKEIYGGVSGQFIVHDINQGQHSEGSKHYLGEAIDGHFRGLNLFQTTMILFKAHFSGIGLYPEWKHKGVHADIRDQNHVSTWVQKNGIYIYDWNFFVEQLELEIECPEAA